MIGTVSIFFVALNALMRVQDPAPHAELQRITLDDAVLKGLSTDIISGVSALERDHSKQMERVVKLSIIPEVSIIARINTRTAQSDFGPIGARSVFGVRSDWVFYDGGERMDRLHAAEKDSQATEARLQGKVSTRSTEVIHAYYELLAAQEKKTLLDLNLQVARNNVTAAKGRLGLGLATEGDVLSAQSAAASSEADAIDYAFTLSSARLNLQYLLGMSTEKPMLEAVTPPALAGGIPANALDLAVANDPNLREMKASMESKRANLSALRASFAPVVRFFGEVSRANSDQSGAGALQGHNVVLAGVVIQQPVAPIAVKRAKEKADIDVMKSDELNYANAKELLLKELRLMLGQYDTLRARQPSLDAAVDAAKEASRLAQGRYQIGTATQSEVIASMRELEHATEAQSLAISEQNMLMRVILFRAAGGTTTTQPGRMGGSGR